MIRRLLIYALALVPLVVVTSFVFPFVTGKAIMFRVLVDASLAAWLYAALRRGVILRCSPILLAFSALIVTIGVSTLRAPSIVRAFWSGLERMDGYVTLLHLFVLFVVAGAVFCRERDWRWFWDCWLWAGTIVTGFGAFQLYMGGSLYGGGMRFDSSLGAPVYLGTFALWQIGIAAWRLTQRPRFPWHWAVLPIAAIALYASGARAAMLGCAAGIAVAGLLWPQLRHRWLLAFGLTAVIGLLGADMLASNNRLAIKIYGVAQGTDASAMTHLVIWQDAAKGILERPLLGWGPEGERAVDAKYPDPRVDIGPMHWDRAHNVILDWALDGGVIGLAAYLSLWAAAGMAIWRLPGTERAVLAGLLVAYFVNLLFVFDSISSYIPFVMLLGWLHFQTASWPRRYQPWTLDRVSAGALALGCGVWLLSAVNSPAIYASRTVFLTAFGHH